MRSCTKIGRRKQEQEVILGKEVIDYDKVTFFQEWQGSKQADYLTSADQAIPG